MIETLTMIISASPPFLTDGLCIARGCLPVKTASAANEKLVEDTDKHKQPNKALRATIKPKAKDCSILVNNKSKVEAK